ncbi:MAG: hypothetical protein V4574_22000 [Pseudomonadota bacterium]
MKLPPLAIGAGAGLVLALLLAPATGTALGKLDAARAERSELTAMLAEPVPPPAPLVVSGLPLGGDAALLAANVRERARSGGVLVEEIADVSPAGRLAVLRLRLSGPEKSVVALADSLERDAPMVRLRGWRLAAIAGGVRLTGEAVAVRR